RGSALRRAPRTGTFAQLFFRHAVPSSARSRYCHHIQSVTEIMDMPESTSAAAAFSRLRSELEQCIIGQQALVDRLLIALLADGHLLVEGAPGLAKTTAIKELAARIEADFHRVQFTPDLLPADLTGT